MFSDKIIVQPNVQIGGTTLVNADCFDVFPLIGDKSVDAIICDLPYGTTKNKWDCVLDLNKLWEQYKRIIKDGGAIILFAQTPFDKVLGASNLPMLKYEWIWRKSRPTGHLNANKMPMKAHENILVFYKNIPTFNKQMTIGKPNHVKDGSIRKSKATNNNYGHFENVVQKSTELKNPITVIEFSQQDPNKIKHPTQKPLDLMEYLVKTYTNEGDMVLDNTMGSGTTNLACVKLNRKSIGVEKEKKYYDIAVKRVSEQAARYF